jgi:hypothetical protein
MAGPAIGRGGLVSSKCLHSQCAGVCGPPAGVGGRIRWRGRQISNGCCTAANDTAVQIAAKAVGIQFDLTVYPDADHDIVKGGRNYNAKAYEETSKYMENILKVYLSN